MSKAHQKKKKKKCCKADFCVSVWVSCVVEPKNSDGKKEQSIWCVLRVREKSHCQNPSSAPATPRHLVPLTIGLRTQWQVLLGLNYPFIRQQKCVFFRSLSWMLLFRETAFQTRDMPSIYLLPYMQLSAGALEHSTKVSFLWLSEHLLTSVTLPLPVQLCLSTQ